VCPCVCSDVCVCVCSDASYVVCERARTRHLCGMKNSCLDLVQDSVELRGYRVAALKDWVLDQSK